MRFSQQGNKVGCYAIHSGRNVTKCWNSILQPSLGVKSKPYKQKEKLCLVYSLNLKSEDEHFSEMLIYFYKTTWHKITENNYSS
jgi:hypothetical protein